MSYGGQSNPTVVDRKYFRTRTVTLNPTVALTTYNFPRNAGTFEIRIVTSDAPVDDMSFFVIGGYGVPTGEKGRAYYTNAGIAPRNCTITSEVIDKPTYTTTFTVTAGAGMTARIFTFTMCTYQTVPFTVSYNVTNITSLELSIIDTVYDVKI